jgi:ABC-type taurine transport system ATPase subunit
MHGMIVRRIEVEGGFLDGLDLALTDGLNVLIGPRGAGKTSVLELLRFGLNVPAMTDEAQRQAREQAEAVLADGRVTVTIHIDGSETRVTRNAVDEAPRSELQALPTQLLFVSQNELEAIGLDARSRRRILDQIVEPQLNDEVEAAAVLRARAIVKQADELRHTREQLLDSLEGVAEAPEQLSQAVQDANAIAETDHQIVSLQSEVETLSSRAAGFERQREADDAAASVLNDWVERVDAFAEDGPDLTVVPEDVRPEAASAVQFVETAALEARKRLADLTARLDQRASEAADKAIEIRREVRERGERLETLREGAGERARRLAELHRLVEDRDQLLERLEAVERQLLELDERRAVALNELDEVRTARFQARAAEAARLGALFSNEVEVRVAKAGATSEYASALGEALQGSGMQYKALSRELASRVAPRELVETVERGDASHLASIAGISQERAERVVAHLRGQSTADLLLCPVEDSVDLALLDGQRFKTTSELSMGQRCTVVLPLLLAEGRDLTVLDQPEDHLDNAFIVDTVVESLRRRRPGAQLIIATHNANIPVLAEADRVVVLGSNGRRGFIRHAGPLEASETVRSITDLMEGGARAFDARAHFYADHRD